MFLKLKCTKIRTGEDVKKSFLGTSLGVQWLRLPGHVREASSIPGQGIKIPHTPEPMRHNEDPMQPKLK